MIGNVGTRATRTRSAEEPLVGSCPMGRTPCIPLELLLCSTYVGTLILTHDRDESADSFDRRVL